MAALPDAAYVYMVRCTGGQLYTGWTNHPAARLKAHQSGKGARYTRAHGAVGFCLSGALRGQERRFAAGSRPEKAFQGGKRGAVRRMARRRVSRGGERLKMPSALLWAYSAENIF